MARHMNPRKCLHITWKPPAVQCPACGTVMLIPKPQPKPNPDQEALYARICKIPTCGCYGEAHP